MTTQTYTVTVNKRGTREWYNSQGQRHRTDGPAVEYADGSCEWFLNGQRHRTLGPAVEWANGDREWWLNDHLNRSDGPALEWLNGTRAWYQNGQCHRTDGPAVESIDGNREWWLNGVQLTEQEWRVRVNAKPTCEGRVVEIDGVKYRLTAV